MELAPRTMRMNLHALSLKGFLITLGVFVGVLLVVILVGALGPKPFDYRPEDNEITVNAIDEPFTAYIDASKLNQRIVLTAYVLNSKVAVGNSNYYTLNFTTSLKGLNPTTGAWEVMSEPSIHSRTIECVPSEEYCSSIVLMHKPYIVLNSFEFSVMPMNLAEANPNFQGIVYQFYLVNASFTLFELWFRFIFLLATFIFIVIYAVKLRGFEWKDWTIEQRWVALLLFGLLAFNNPFFPITILVENWFPIFLDQMLFVCFLVLLMFFWLIMFDGIRVEPQAQLFKTFYLPKLILMGIFFVVALTVFTWLEMQQINDPAHSATEYGGFIFFQIMLIILAVIYALWLLFAVFRTVAERHNIPHLDRRVKFFGVFTLLVLLATVAGVIFGAFGPIVNNGAQLLSFLALFNLYVFTLAFVYFPARDVVGRAQTSGMVKLDDLDEDEGGNKHHMSPVPETRPQPTYVPSIPKREEPAPYSPPKRVDPPPREKLPEDNGNIKISFGDDDDDDL